jgi:hypothetical protein
MIANLILLLTALAQCATVAGIFLLRHQIELSRRTTEGQLINELEKEFSTYYSVFAKLEPGGAWHGHASLSADDVAPLEMLTSFCEKLKHFVDRGILDWKTLDLMFRNRFFLIIDNINVIEKVIEPCRRDWVALQALEKQWRGRLPLDDARRTAAPMVLAGAAQQAVAAGGAGNLARLGSPPRG